MWLVAGLLIGLLVAGLVYLKQNPTDNKPVASSTNKPAAVKKPVKKAAPKPVDESPRFDFYDMLPEMEVEVPREAPATSSTKSDQPTARYVLQVGSFRTLKQADSLKAKLAFLGYQATIQTVTVNNNSTWHRVHLGPYTGRKELNKVRAKLWENKINTVPMRISN
ncbi:hypothetical protein BOW53_00030 [Solemya pervernicosa gill symbiont]|uniref:SPOR domain-containing protein n=1 Tax=Solemya pervernicosa gill symbiont TaxID=642797 RepID=A0A1T2LBJ0_9GAMM|nr:hypothetical protein BOW53_00030 [Solemya pervernicosa gill symbiont]